LIVGTLLGFALGATDGATEGSAEGELLGAVDAIGDADTEGRGVVTPIGTGELPLALHPAIREKRAAAPNSFICI
jgi:hypothetical protein